MLVETRNLSLRIGVRTIYESVNLGLESGRFISIIGPSGSGKTSFLGMIAGLLEPTSGSISFSPDVPRPRIDWIVQSTPLMNQRTALANVALGPLSQGATAQGSVVVACRAMNALGILGLARQRVSRLSGGERQRVAVARFIAAASPVILADEPTASLDPISREAVCGALEAAARRGALVLVATHDPYVAGRCDQVLRVVNGNIEVS